MWAHMGDSIRAPLVGGRMKYNPPPPRRTHTLKTLEAARKRRREYMEKWSIRVSQLERVRVEILGAK